MILSTPIKSLYRTKSLSLGPQLKIHAISTGTVSVKANFKHKKGAGLISKLNLFRGPMTEPLPINVYVIEHPEGVIVVDTGENARVNDPDYFAEASWLQKQFQKTVSFEVERDEEIGPQLDALGIERSRLRWVVLTHLHLDHTDGLHHFPNTEILVHQKELDRPFGDAPHTYPEWFEPKGFSLNQMGLGAFDQVHYLTQSKDVMLVPLPGHTYGQVGVLLKAKDQYFLFAGDATYDQQQLAKHELAGGHVDFRAAATSMEKIKRFAKQYPLVYLPAHDPSAGERLVSTTIFKH
ncbi:MAG: N-acyl homoserine lactonase family protein [Bacteroidota bacterium]